MTGFLPTMAAIGALALAAGAPTAWRQSDPDPSDRSESPGRGVPFERIRPIWFGWEPPQTDEMIAAEYGISDLVSEYGKAGVNQSVVMVIF